MERIDNITDTALCVTSACATMTTRLRKMRSSITSTASSMRPDLQGTIRQQFGKRNCREFRWRQISIPSPRPGNVLAKLHLRLRDLPGVPAEPRHSVRTENRDLSTSGLANVLCGIANDERSELIVNELYPSRRAFRAKAHEYQVNGRTPLEWFIDRYKISPG